MKSGLLFVGYSLDGISFSGGLNVNFIMRICFRVLVETIGQQPVSVLLSFSVPHILAFAVFAHFIVNASNLPSKRVYYFPAMFIYPIVL